MAGRFEGKQALILGVANKRSIAWAIAKRLHEEGAELAFTFQGERIEKGVRELAESVGAKLVTECDVRSDDDVARVFAETGEAFGGGSTCSSTPSRSQPPRISRVASSIPRATASGWRSTSRRTRSSPCARRPSR